MFCIFALLFQKSANSSFEAAALLYKTVFKANNDRGEKTGI